jgi:hypothetical protein
MDRIPNALALVSRIVLRKYIFINSENERSGLVTVTESVKNNTHDVYISDDFNDVRFSTTIILVITLTDVRFVISSLKNSV